MSAQIIQFGAYQAAAPQGGYKNRGSRAKAVSEDASFFAFREGSGCEDFMRGRKLAKALINKADSAALEHIFQALVFEAMQRAKRGGKRSRRPWTPANDGFLQAISRYVANGEVLEA
jgi:hypothetical protein